MVEFEKDVQTLSVDGWVIGVRQPEGSGPHPVMLLLHGLTGDENVMWIFTPRLPAGFLYLAPRGRFESPLGGYSWDPIASEEYPRVDDLQPAVEDLLSLLTPDHFPDADFTRLHVMGFSQGAALAYTFSLSHPDRVVSVAGLAGFMPDGAETLFEGRPLEGKSVFVAHGTRDELVPVRKAREAVEALEKAGALVTYCEEDVGHKVHADCFRGLGLFFRKLGKND